MPDRKPRSPLPHVVAAGQQWAQARLYFALVLDDGLTIFCNNSWVSATRFPAFFCRTRTSLERGEIHVAIQILSSPGMQLAVHQPHWH
ncbi:MAG: hypothetical protein MK364_05195, partial [Pirellulales bacterium]|nr:hypothetical protein [Pirellulales bacterium]